MDEHRKQAGERVAQLRDARGMSQEDLAQEASVSVKTISRFENGRHDGRRTTVRRIADALGVDEADIIGPPLDPLGLGSPTQLDRIEAKLDELLVILRPSESEKSPQEIADEELRRRDTKRRGADAPPRQPRKKGQAA
jgi:transcriptional regulator with XRE-family HTH domain